MHTLDPDTRCYATRLLNPFQGVMMIVETTAARATSVDGVNWCIEILSQIYKTPWCSMAIHTPSERYFSYGVWSAQDGLARIPVHPSLYLEHVEQAIHDLLAQLTTLSQRIPFRLADSLELWLMDAAAQQPVALIASRLPNDVVPIVNSLQWYAAPNIDTPFRSTAFASEQVKSTTPIQPQDLLQRLIKQRCQPPYQALWIERHPDGSGDIRYNHAGKSQQQNEQLDANSFPACLLNEHWSQPEAQQLIADYLHWQAPLLLMLPLAAPRRREIEQQAQQRPLSVHTHHRLYPEVIDQRLLNKILVEAVLRKATV